MEVETSLDVLSRAASLVETGSEVKQSVERKCSLLSNECLNLCYSRRNGESGRLLGISNALIIRLDSL